MFNAGAYVDLSSAARVVGELPPEYPIMTTAAPRSTPVKSLDSKEARMPFNTA